MGTRLSLFLLITVLAGAACQTPTTLYDRFSFSSPPTSRGYTNSDAFVRDSIVYWYPRVCAFYQTSDGARAGANQRPDKFSINSIIENEKKDGWFIGYLAVSNADSGGALGFYFNRDTGDYSCTGRRTAKTKTGIPFVNGRWLDLASLASAGK